MSEDRLKVGDRVRLFGGYDQEPAWLSWREAVRGTLASFIPGQNEEPAAVLRLDEPLTAEGAAGDIVVLELRYVGARWENHGVVHVELCDFDPEPKTWSERRQGRWVESHASYEKMSQQQS